MNSFNNNENVPVSSEVESNSLLINYDDFEEGYTPSEVWVVVPESARWSVDFSTPTLISELENTVVREDGNIEVRFEGDFLNNKTVTLYCQSSSDFDSWTYLDINFPTYDAEGNHLFTHSSGWNIRTSPSD